MSELQVQFNCLRNDLQQVAEQMCQLLQMVDPEVVNARGSRPVK